MAAEPPTTRLQSALQAAVQTINWTYILFWKLCPQQGFLVWSDGYYNGAIKTRKTVQPIELSTEEAALQRSQQLQELYESLSAGETRWPSAALTPEDLTESECFYLMCISFSFPPGIGLPGQAYVKKQHIWLTEASEVDSKLFSRAILAKSAGIQTVVCIPLLDGVVELGKMEMVEEDVGLIQRVKTFFLGDPMPRFQSQVTVPCPSENPTLEICQIHLAEGDDWDRDWVESDSEAETHRVAGASQLVTHPTREPPSELMQLDLSEDIRLGSPDDDDASNHLESDFHLLAVSGSENLLEHRAGYGELVRAKTIPSADILEEAHYSQTVSAILELQPSRCSFTASAFSNWTPSASFSYSAGGTFSAAAQSTLKYILFTVPHLHGAKSRDRRPTPYDDLNASHMLAERRRREKLKERFIILRSMVPLVTKMDKASILGDAIEYVKQLQRRIKELEAEKELGNWREEKKKMKVNVKERGGVQCRPRVDESVEVSIIERDALVEIECRHSREGVLLEVMQLLRGLNMEVTTAQCSIASGVFAAELRAKVKEEVKDRKVSIMEVKRLIHQLILLPYSLERVVSRP